MARIYTRSGDAGETGLIGGARVPKDNPRVAAFGEIDELNAAVGLARALMAGKKPLAALEEALSGIQSELFELGAELAVDPAAGLAPRISAAHAQALEKAIDRLEDRLPKLDHFILPGGSPAGAALHLARAVCRRAERSVLALSRSSPVGRDARVYLNRLSDYLFTAARAANRLSRKPEMRWPPKSR